MTKGKNFAGFLFVLFFFSLINVAEARTEVIDVSNLKNVGITIHLIELVLAIFISYMSLKFFRITRPVNLFLYMYLALGFFIINTALYLLYYLSIDTNFELGFINVYIGGRIALMGMLVSFVILFYQWHRVMRRTNVK